VSVVLGTRPEAIKLAPVIRALRSRPKVSCTVCSTGQHALMLRQALGAFGLAADVELAVMEHAQGLAGLTSRLFAGIDEILSCHEPDWVVVQGDTTSAYVGAMAAFYRRIRVAHVEAGLRTGDRTAPFPEEVNRRAISLVADLHFAPTAGAADNLRREGVAESAIVVTGNTAVDALEWARSLVRATTPLSLPNHLPGLLEGRRLVLVTSHRRESFGIGLDNICRAVQDLAGQFEDVVFVYPVHLNPDVLGPVNTILGGHPRVILLGPVDYLAMVWLLNRSQLILTDSGGIQEEAPTFGVPLLVLRETTERPEMVEAGGALVVGADRERIVAMASKLLSSEATHAALRPRSNPFGDGAAAERIADALVPTAVS
jgi:UDP-N-acetylglucosamine 2-epimerase